MEMARLILGEFDFLCIGDKYLKKRFHFAHLYILNLVATHLKK